MGCAGVVLVPTLVLVVLLVLGLLTGGREERIEPVSRSYAIPPSANPVAEPGKIKLDLTRGAFSIMPGEPGEPLRLEGRYDDGHFKLEEHKETYGEVGWIYHVSLEQRGLGLRPLIEHDGPTNDLRLIVPRDVPLALVGSIGLAESHLELGGLWLVDVDLELGIGEHELGFSEPLRAPLDRFRVDSSIGELRILSVGNASPAFVEVTRSVGDMLLDLRGDWRRDAKIDVSCGIGECRLRVPRDVRIDLQAADIMIGESNLGTLTDGQRFPSGAPVLSLAVAGTIGEIRVDR